MKRFAQIARYITIAFIALMTLAAVSGLIWWVSLPRHEGKTVYYWFRTARERAQFRPATPEGPSREEAELAFVRMGPRAIEFLIAKLELDNRPRPLPPLVERFSPYLARFEWGRQFLLNSAREDWFTADRLLSSLVRRVKRKPATLLPLTASVLKAPDPRLRAEVLQQLQRFGPEASPAVLPIAEALNDDYVYVRLEAAKALGAIGPAAASVLEALNERERDTHGEVVQASRAARNAISGSGN